MRLDKYLKVSRLIKRRTVANEACDGDRVTVNGRQVKASYQVKLGDVIEIAFGQRTLKVEVTQRNRVNAKGIPQSAGCLLHKRSIKLCLYQSRNFLSASGTVSGSAETLMKNSIFSASEKASSPETNFTRASSDLSPTSL